MPITRIALLITGMLITTAQAEEASAKDATAKDASARETQFTVVPLAGYTPETSGMAAALMMVFLPTQTDRRSNISLAAAGTLKGQFMLTTGANLYTFNDQLQLRANLAARQWNAEFYGVGDGVGTASETYDSQSLSARLDALYQIIPRLYLGPSMDVAYDDFDIVEDGRLDSFGVIGEAGGFRLGGGGALLWDDRDRPMSTRKGTWANLSALWYGGDFAHQLTTLDMRGWATIPHIGTLGGQILGQFSAGNTPFYALPGLGGANQSRGIFANRFRDTHAVTTQAEFRRHIAWRFSGAVFGSVGRVAPTLGDLTDAAPQWAGGAGTRFLMDADTGVSLRLDVGVSRDETGVYFSIGEPF